MKIEVRFNTRLNGTEWNKVGGKDDGWKKIEDGAADSLAYRIEEQCVTYPQVVDRKAGKSLKMKNLKFSAAAWRRGLDANGWKKQVDPFILYLEKLPKWDGTPRVDTLIQHFFLSNSPAGIQAWGIWGVMGGSIRRAYKPGAKQDEMPILVGRQGIGKSSFWELLLPNEDWFSDNLNLSDNAQQRIESLMGNVLVECPELQGITRTELNSLKAFMSRSNDKMRKPYGHYPASLPRRIMIVGTTNNENCLPPDTTGNRRFVPVRVDGSLNLPVRIRAELPEMRDQLWAESLVRYNKGEPSHFPTELMETLTSESKQHETEDEVLMTLVAEALQRIEHHGPAKDCVKMAHVAKAMDIPWPPKTHVQKDIGLGLRKAGYSAVNHNALGRVWRTKNPPTPL